MAYGCQDAQVCGPNRASGHLQNSMVSEGWQRVKVRPAKIKPAGVVLRLTQGSWLRRAARKLLAGEGNEFGRLVEACPELRALSEPGAFVVKPLDELAFEKVEAGGIRVVGIFHKVDDKAVVSNLELRIVCDVGDVFSKPDSAVAVDESRPLNWNWAFTLDELLGHGVISHGDLSTAAEAIQVLTSAVARAAMGEKV
ncbi:hypothetical protein [Aquabacterium sp.]|uniref:hypothetical protein n=1 Tax=Aquabacterium sp. TaxID=1872578 RepID=UPI0025BB0C1B|nr:hypothetical protein [Aquabacterium sp.]